MQVCSKLPGFPAEKYYDRNCGFSSACQACLGKTVRICIMLGHNILMMENQNSFQYTKIGKMNLIRKRFIYSMLVMTKKYSNFVTGFFICNLYETTW